MDFIPHDDKTINDMLEIIGVKDISELFKDIPKNIIIDKLNIPPGLPEPDLLELLKHISNNNKIYSNSFLGAGCYYHYIPSLVDFVISRSEFYTAYTPYQAEASQGYLQAIYEYQTMISHLTNMDIANASMYDGSTALAEAIIMATVVTRKKKVLILDGLHPEYLEVLKTYCWGQDIKFSIINENQISKELDDNVAAFIFQSPNFFGEIEQVEILVKKVRDNASNCLVIQCMTDPTCLGILKSPGDVGIDIFVAEGQSFGINPTFGGPGLGIFAANKKYLRKVPGRLVGKTTELDGEKEGFLLTLQAREQHIRREKASSNICTNQALCALASLIYLLSIGKTGLKEIASQNFQKAHYVKNLLKNMPGYEILNSKPTYNEFILKCPDLDRFIAECKKKDLLPPLDLSHYFPDKKQIALVCVTESNSRESIDKLIEAAKIASNYRKEDKK